MVHIMKGEIFMKKIKVIVEPNTTIHKGSQKTPDFMIR